MSYMTELLKTGDLQQSGITQHLTTLIREHDSHSSPLKNELQLFSHYLQSTKFKLAETCSDTLLQHKLSRPKEYPFLVRASQSLPTASTQQTACVRPDVMQEYHALRTAGISIGETNAYYLNCQLKKLAVEHSATSLRFWGKILGQKDYYVVQGYSTKPHDTLPNAEAYGVGVNRYSYYVATNILKTWVELPLVSSEQVRASRTFKHIFSGNLDAVVMKGSFVGCEKHLLKCIIARITHSCELVPKGVYRLSEENAVEYEEEIKMMEVSEMASVDSWVRVNPHILLQGRCSHFIDPSLTEEQKEALTAELNEKDPIVDKLKNITEDKPIDPFPAAWTATLCGESVAVGQSGRQEGQSVVYGVALVRSVAWPGAATVGWRGGWTNIYVGYGHRLSQHYTAIRQLKDLQLEGPPKLEKTEPNPPHPIFKKEELKQEPKEEEPNES